MRRRDILAGSLLALGAGAVLAQPKARTPRILLIGPAWSEPSRSWKTFLIELGRLGYEEGVNILVTRIEGEIGDWRKRGHKGWSEVTEEIARNLPDVIVVSSSIWARWLHGMNTTIPIIASVLSPIEQGLVPNLARPASNLTGVAVDTGAAFLGKQLDLLLEVLPGASQIACLGADALYYSGMRQFWSDAKSRGVSVQEFVVVDRYEPIFSEMMRGGANAVLILADAFHTLHASIIAELVRHHRLPLISPFRRLTELGGLMSYGSDWAEVDRRLAAYVVRILKGAKPGDLSIEQPTKFELVLNATTAAQLGLTFSASILSIADEVTV